MEGVKLTFEPDSLHAVIHEARRRKTGARALRAIVEESLMDALFEVPSRKDVSEVIIGAETVLDKKPARFVELKKKSA
jgi:ATP-dependent Clp protease ATP-binding subunit ClpX